MMFLQFKEFVHAYLDAHGVPADDPQNQHSKEGCRIGARLDLLFAQRDKALADAAALREALWDAGKSGGADCPECGTWLGGDLHDPACRIGAALAAWERAGG